MFQFVRIRRLVMVLFLHAEFWLCKYSLIVTGRKHGVQKNQGALCAL